MLVNSRGTQTNKGATAEPLYFNYCSQIKAINQAEKIFTQVLTICIMINVISHRPFEGRRFKIIFYVVFIRKPKASDGADSAA
jgi:hypothetical protein